MRRPTIYVTLDGYSSLVSGLGTPPKAVDAVTMRNLFRSTIVSIAADAAGYDVFAENASIEELERTQLEEFVRGRSA
jgi:hypothetical protein